MTPRSSKAATSFFFSFFSFCMILDAISVAFLFCFYFIFFFGSSLHSARRSLSVERTPASEIRLCFTLRFFFGGIFSFSFFFFAFRLSVTFAPLKKKAPALNDRKCLQDLFIFLGLFFSFGCSVK